MYIVFWDGCMYGEYNNRKEARDTAEAGQGRLGGDWVVYKLYYRCTSIE